MVVPKKKVWLFPLSPGPSSVKSAKVSYDTAFHVLRGVHLGLSTHGMPFNSRIRGADVENTGEQKQCMVAIVSDMSASGDFGLKIAVLAEVTLR